ncbi:MAG: SRPBCC family protein [Cyclobacteriaceae bacterium]
MTQKHLSLARNGKINEQASVRDAQSTIINAPIEKIWDHVMSIDKWHEWNSEIVTQISDQVSEGTRYDLNMRGHKFHNTIESIKAPYLLSSNGKTKWLKCILIWKLEKTEEYQTIASVEMSIEGILSTLFYSHHGVHSDLLNWLARLKQVAEQ